MSDLATNEAGAAARAKREEVNSQAPVFNFIARVIGMTTEERNWRVGAKGEEKVGKELAALPAGWHSIHAVPVGERGSDIDHVVIGPAGVFTLNTKRHPNQRVTVYENTIYVSGHQQPYIRNSRHEAARAASLLTAACDVPVETRGLVVFVDLGDFKVKAMPADVHVTTRVNVHRWLTSQPAHLNPLQVAHIYLHARDTLTWQQ